MSQVSENKMVEDNYRVPHPGDVGKTVWVRDSEHPKADDAVWQARTLVAVLPDAQPGDKSHRSFVCAVQGKTALNICHSWRFALIPKDQQMKPWPGPSPSANVPESPDSSVDHSADANKMVEPVVKQSLTSEEIANRNQTVKQIVALTEEDGDEALYVDGVLTACDSTIYACDIAEAAANATVTFSHRNVEQSVSVWPKKLSDVFSANVSETPDSSVADHVPDVTKMVEPKIVARYDTEGRDVTELPGLWSEDDIQYRDLTEDDRKNLPIKCEVRGSRGQEWYKAKLIKFCENPTHPYIAETDHGKLVQAAHCRIKVTPVVKQFLKPDTPDPTEPRKRVLYIAGPMRGIAFFNYPMFDRVAKNLREAGNEVISPADEDRKQDGFDPFANPEYRIPDACVFPKEMDFHKTVRRCLDAVLRCDEIVLLPGWEKSNGAVAELTLAMWLGKRVRHLRISEGGYFSWSCYWMGLEALACLLRDHHIPQVAAPAPVVVDEDDDDEDILDTAARITRGDRNASYGPPDQDFRRTAGMWSALFQAKLQDGVTFEPRDVAMAMILLKCSRESHQRKLDNWVDIAGYARCGSMCN